MIILGKNTDDKGTQLERLIEALLQHLGYRNVACNRVGAGAEELDVTAQFTTPILGGAMSSEVICECKAYRTPVDLTAWLKFLGKLYTADSKTNQQTIGCFVALSGVNGNFLGHFTELCKHRANLRLLHGDALLEETKKVFPFIALAELASTVSRRTDRTVRTQEIAYYHRQVYWIVGFDHDAYTVLDANGSSLAPDAAAPLTKMIGDDYAFGQYVDLLAEETARFRALLAQKFVIAAIMDAGGTIDRMPPCGGDDPLVDDEIDQAITDLKTRGMINGTAQPEKLNLVTADASGQPVRLGGLYRLLLQDAVYVHSVGCRWYDEHINDQLLDEILETQGGLPLDNERRERAIHLMKLSPKALHVVLMPVDLIANHRKSGATTKEIDECDIGIFFQTLYNSFLRDFRTQALCEYFHETRGLVETDMTTHLRVKSGAKVEIEDTVRIRNRIGRLDESLVDGKRVFALIHLLNSTKEPWEEISRPSDSELQTPPPLPA